MKIYVLRHGETAWNAAGRYQGLTDIPLSPEGRAALVPADFTVESVVVSPLLRARQTAEILFPGAAQQIETGLQEMDFGVFEGRTAQEMECDSAYRAWVDSGCTGPVPGGESLETFRRRVCGTFTRILENARAQDRDPLVLVAHGGTLMAILAQYAEPRREYFTWQAPHGGGWLLDASGESLRTLRPVCYAKEETPC